MKFYFYKNDKKSWTPILQNLRNTLNEELYTKDCMVEIKKITKEPTDPMRKYYFGYVLPPIQKEFENLGNDKRSIEEVHNIMKERTFFFKYSKVKTKGGYIENKVYGSISNKEGDRKESLEYIESCRRWAAEFLSIVIPDPIKYGIEIK